MGRGETKYNISGYHPHVNGLYRIFGIYRVFELPLDSLGSGLPGWFLHPKQEVPSVLKYQCKRGYLQPFCFSPLPFPNFTAAQYDPYTHD